LITAVKFSPDGRHLISVGGDGCIMVWEMAEHLVEAMQDRLVELYALAERKKQIADERAEQLSAQVQPGQESDKVKPAIRTGGLSVKSREAAPDGIVGKALGSKQRPSTSAPTAERSTPSRPFTAGDQVKQKPAIRRLPAWAATKGSVPEASRSGDPSTHPPQSKWADRANDQNLQILGKPMVTKEKHKLTLELTAEEQTWRESANADRLAMSLEDSDDVLLMDPQSLAEDYDSSDDDELVTENDDLEDRETDRLNQTSSQLDKLEESVDQLESWIEKKVHSPSPLSLSLSASDPPFPSS
jgi:hypothetical protein